MHLNYIVIPCNANGCIETSNFIYQIQIAPSSFHLDFINKELSSIFRFQVFTFSSFSSCEHYIRGIWSVVSNLTSIGVMLQDHFLTINFKWGGTNKQHLRFANMA
jgi:hypothetical protein